MTTKLENKLSATKLFENLPIGGREEDNRNYDYLNRERATFHKLNPDRRIILSKSKFKKGVTIIMRAE